MEKGYTYPGMRIIEGEELQKRLRLCDFDGLYMLHDDNTETAIESGVGIEEIKDFLAKGGRIGEEYEKINLPDGGTVYAPKKIDISKLEMFDEMEDALLDIIKGYFALFGIKPTEDQDEDDCENFYLAKKMQDALLDELRDCSVNFVNGDPYPEPVKTGQKRQWNDSGRVFTVGNLVYDDRDFRECTYEDGSSKHHSEHLILCRTSIVG